MNTHELQRATAKASLAAMESDNQYPVDVMTQLETLLEELFQAAEKEFFDGVPQEYLKRVSSMNTFAALLLAMVRHANRKK